MKRIVTALAALLAIAGCHEAPSGTGSQTVLRVGSQKGGTKAVMLASGALEGAPYAVEWSEFPAAQQLLEAIGSNAVDLGLTGDAPFMFAYQSGSPVRAVAAQTMGKYPAGALSIVVPANSPIKTLADLKGKKVATTRGSVGHYLVIRALAQAKLPPDFVNLIFLGPGDAKAAFSSGAIDAWSVWVPYTSTALKEGARIVVDAPGLIHSYGFDVTNVRSLAANRAALKDFTAREAKALTWARGHPEAYAEVLAKETGLPPDIALDYATKNARLAVPLDAAVVESGRQVLSDFQRTGSFTTGKPLEAAFERIDGK